MTQDYELDLEDEENSELVNEIKKTVEMYGGYVKDTKIGGATGTAAGFGASAITGADPALATGLGYTLGANSDALIRSFRKDNIDSYKLDRDEALALTGLVGGGAAASYTAANYGEVEEAASSTAGEGADVAKELGAGFADLLAEAGTTAQDIGLEAVNAALSSGDEIALGIGASIAGMTAGSVAVASYLYRKDQDEEE